MNSLFDVMLDQPFSDPIIHSLLFFLFSLHMLFVLFAVGTAILAVINFIQTRRHKDPVRFEWGHEILKTFLAHKSLAVVLGVGPLLLIQVGLSVPFFTATNLMAPFWLSIIILLIAAFFLLDFPAHFLSKDRPALYLILSAAGLMLLLVVPAIFVAVLILTEHPAQWIPMMQNNFRFPNSLAWHWVFRYLHVLGAAVVFAGVFHYLISKQDQAHKKAVLLKWVVGGLLYQVVLGMLLYFSLPENFDELTNISLVVGIAGAMLLLWIVFRQQSLKLPAAVFLLGLILISMLLVRQLIQTNHLAPLQAELQQQSYAYEQILQPYEAMGLDNYEADLYARVDSGQPLYDRSCAFCHGGAPEAKPPSAAEQLEIPPEILVAVRSNPLYLQQRLREGVPGSGMPYFTFYTDEKLEELIRHLDSAYGVLSSPEPLTMTIVAAERQAAKQVFAQTCVPCHGENGTARTPAAQALQPPPPNFQQFTITPQRRFDVISNGYPGTAMVAYDHVSEDVRWGLVEIVGNFYLPK